MGLRRARVGGFATIKVSDPDMPFSSLVVAALPHGRLGTTFVHEIHHPHRHQDDGDVAPYSATFEDGYRAAEVCDAILRSAETGEREHVQYRESTNPSAAHVDEPPG
jgi:predicted dehydrogenase